MATTRGRVILANEVVLDQADLFQLDGFTRVLGLTPNDLTLQLFYKNIAQPWLFLSGYGVPDAQVASGKVYWNEVQGSPGIYNVRFRPNAVGYWRMLITYAPGTQIVGQDYDVRDAQPVVESGLKASFIKPKDC